MEQSPRYKFSLCEVIGHRGGETGNRVKSWLPKRCDDASSLVLIPNFQQVRVGSVADPPWQRSSYGHSHTAHYTVSMLMLAFHPAQLLARLSTDVCELFIRVGMLALK